jgi:hypothetical protein
LTQTRRNGSSATVRSRSSVISSTDGTRGEWMSYTPGPMPATKPDVAMSPITSPRLRAASIEVTSASSAAIASITTSNSE